MKGYYQTVKKDDLVLPPSVVVQSEVSLYRDAYLSACSILRVAPEKGVGRASQRTNHLRNEANEIAKFWIEDDNQCKRLMISYLFCTMYLTF